VVAVLLAGGTAYAVWSTTGTGAGTATARGFQAVTVTAGTAPAGQLYPGLTADGSTAGGDLVVNANNPNPFPVSVSVLVSSVSGCTTPGVSIPGSVTASFALPASSGTVSRTMSKVLSMSTASSSDCQGQTLTVSLTTTAVSS
jgi:hypothetical protein